MVFNKNTMEVNPLSIILVKSDSKGERLLFRYPYEAEMISDIHDQRNGRRNPYAVSIIEDLLQTPMPQTSNIQKGQLTGFTDEVLSTLFAVKPELCHRKFELKVNDVRFVGHPTLLPFRANKDDETSSPLLINIVFALQALASHSIVKCYYDLSKRLGKALRHEENRCAFLTDEMKIMIAMHDELTNMDSDSDDPGDPAESCNTPANPPSTPFHHILQKSALAKNLKSVFEDLSNTGVVQVRINQWVLVSFCLPHKAHQFHNRGLVIEPETIDRCLRSLRPYHGMLLLVDPNELLDSIPLDSNPLLIRLIMLYSPLKSLQTLAIEADLTLSQVFQLTGHLVYWAKATIIYPLCESNVYVIAPDAQVHLNSPLVDKFAQDFPGLCLIQVMSMLSLPAPLWFHARAWAGGASLLARCIVWLLQRHLLLQLHTYVQFLPTPLGPPQNGTKDYYCEKHNGLQPTLSDSLVSLNHIPYTTVTTPVSDKSNSDSLIFKSKDSSEPNSPYIPTGLKNGDLTPDEIIKKEPLGGHLKTILKTSNDVIAQNNKNVNPKNVFRENSLIFGDITCESSSESPPSSPESVDSVDHPVANIIIKRSDPIIDTGNVKNIVCKDWSLDLNESLKGSEIGNMVYENNKPLNNNLENGIVCKLAPIEDLNSTGNSGNATICNGDSKHMSPEIILKVVNGLQKLKVDENAKVNNTNAQTLNAVNDKEKIHLTLNSSNSSSGSNVSEKKYNTSLFKHLETSFQPPTVITGLNHFNSCDVVDASVKNNLIINGNVSTEQFTDEMLLADFTEEEKTAIFKIPAAYNPEDLNLMATLYKKGYFRGEQHLEEIMFMENLTRSQVLQLLDKFRDVLITYETEDPAIAMLYSNP